MITQWQGHLAVIVKAFMERQHVVVDTTNTAKAKISSDYI
jgi:hypothetical protein